MKAIFNRMDENILKDKKQLFIFFVVIISLLSAIQYNNLFNPPYGDSLEATFRTAIWLKNHNFNYLDLFKEPTFHNGGVNIYPINIISFIAAVLYNIFNKKMVFFCVHLLILFCSSLIFIVYLKILKLLFNLKWSFSIAILAAFEPIFIGQTSSLYLEIPLALCLALSLYYLIKEKYFKCAIIGVFGYFFIKTSLFLYFADLIIIYLFHLIISYIKKEKFNKKLNFLLLPFSILIIHYIKNTSYTSPVICRWPNLFIKFKFHSLSLFPSLTMSFIFIIILILLTLLNKNKFKLLYNNSQSFNISFYFLVLVLSFWISYYTYSWPLPRYATFIIFPQIILLFILLRLFLSKQLTKIILIILLCWNILNLNGKLFPKTIQPIIRIGAFLERSNEFNKDVISLRKMCDYLSKCFFNSNIICKPYIKYLLTIPDLGYVNKSLPHVYSSNKTSFKEIKNTIKNKQSIILVYAPFEIPKHNSLLPSPEDTFYYVDKTLPIDPILIYEKKL